MVKVASKHILILIITIIVAVVIFNTALGFFLQHKKQERAVPIAPITKTQENKDYVSYQGKDGKDGLMLLKETALVEQETSGLVSGINGRKADAGKHEYWAFYVNGQLAQVGPADYKTKEGDKIEWKIEKY